ncbi:serine/threonine-protein kinase [Actinocorallia longicatena]|uniref:Serine/threonine-protein kinase n=1 Tax=Actinocorallia longicatena TaxID=111803 RepID=A0ABP6QEH2_9ACTN
MADLRDKSGPQPLRLGDPQEIGPYRLTGFIGEGGQGAVYLAETPEGRQVAIKVLHTNLAADERGRARFLRELDAARRVARFCTAQVLDVEVEGSQPYLVSEYVDGPSLRQIVKRTGPLDEASLERLAIGTATALAAIHGAGIVHRDLNPGNVLLGSDGPRVVDFGIAKALESALESTERLGTAAYMAPEQFTTTDLSTAADVFSWAGTMLFAATGEPPFGKVSLGVVMNRIINDDPDLGPLPPSLRPVVARAFARDPLERPDAEQLLQFLLGQVDVRAPEPAPGTGPLPISAPPPPPAPGPSRRRMLAGAGVGAVLLAGGGTAAYLALRPEDEKAPPVLGVERLGVLRGHKEVVSSLAFGRVKKIPILLSAGGRDDTVLAWNLETREALGYRFRHLDYTRSVSVLRTFVASCGGDKTVRLWDLSTGRSLGTVPGPESGTYDVRLAHVKGRDVLLVNAGNHIAVHDLRTKKKLRDIWVDKGNWLGSMTVANTPSGPLVLAGGRDGQIHVWSLVDKSVDRTMGEHNGQINALAYRLVGGRPMVVSGGDDTTVRVWDLANFQQTQRMRGDITVRGVVLTEGFVASGDDKGVLRFWNPLTGEAVRPPLDLGPLGISSLAWDGVSTLAVGGKNSAIELLRVRKPR